jgi:hypothetical protein
MSTCTATGPLGLPGAATATKQLSDAAEGYLAWASDRYAPLMQEQVRSQLRIRPWRASALVGPGWMWLMRM